MTSTGGRLVVISVRDASPLAMRGVGPGARLLTLNGEDVAHVSPAELSARAASLAGMGASWSSRWTTSLLLLLVGRRSDCCGVGLF